MKDLAIAAVVLVAMVTASAADSDRPPAESEFRAGWVAFASVKPGPDGKLTLGAQQEARVAAAARMEAAAEADPGNAVYQASLCYVCLAAGKYARAAEAIDRAIKLKDDDPLFYMLRGQAQAALAHMVPQEAGERILPALTAFEEAARLDPTNALPLVQAASVAVSVGRMDLALSRIERALERPTARLYRLWVPFDLHPERDASINAWQYVQYGYWTSAAARCQNVGMALLSLGAQKMKDEDLDGAARGFRKALEVGRAVGMAEPNLFITVHVAINMMEGAYGGLLQVAEAGHGGNAEQWRGEMGVLQIARTELQNRLQVYLNRLKEDPPETADELLALESDSVERALLGMGLTPVSKKETEKAPEAG